MNEITDMVRKIKGVFEILQRDQMKGTVLTLNLAVFLTIFWHRMIA